MPDDSTHAVQDVNIRSATGSLTRTRSFNTGSLNSNASSLRKKFGIGGLSRENSKNESESKVASIWRSLSKNARSPGESQSQPSSLSKASLGRSRSTDTDSRMLPPSRPVSRDRPTTAWSTPQNEPRSRPGSSHLTTSTLSSIGEGTPHKPSLLTKKKRRSSLSDLVRIQDTDLTTAWSPLQPRKVVHNQDSYGKVQVTPQMPSPVKQSPSQRNNRPSPQLSGLPRRFGSPQHKENSPGQERTSTKLNSSSVPRKPSAKAADDSRAEEIEITTYSPQKRQASRSGIPAPRGGLSERAWPPNGSNIPSKKAIRPPQKLRTQSPQKLSDGLSQEQKAFTSAEISFQTEIAKIGEEMAICESQRSPTKAQSLVMNSQPSSTPVTLQSLFAQLSSLSTTLNNFKTSHTTQLSSISSDIETSLIVSDKKARRLDELYREANAENEALYERFNDELSKILGKVRKGEGIEEMKEKLREAQDEVVKMRKENAKLKREVAGLKSYLKET